jgi:hypothetical protein
MNDLFDGVLYAGECEGLSQQPWWTAVASGMPWCVVWYKCAHIASTLLVQQQTDEANRIVDPACLLNLLFHHEDGSSTFTWNEILSTYTALCSRRCYSSRQFKCNLWKPKVLCW